MKRSDFLGIAIFFLLSVSLVLALSFTSAPLINEDANATTTENLRCEWTASGDTTNTNVSWYLNGASFSNTSGATSPNTIGSGNTTREQIWNCTVTIENGTAVLFNSDLINIVNADPGEIQVFNETDDDVGNHSFLNEDDARTFNVSSIDPDGDEVSYSAIGLPTGGIFNTVTGIFTWTPTNSQVGDTIVTFIALDNQTPVKGSTAKDINFTVLELNDNPTFTPVLVNQTATEGVSFNYTINVSDEESDFPINFTLSSDLPTLIINATSNTTADIFFSNGAPVFTDRGNHTINITINDTRNGSSFSFFNLEVIPVNQLPNMTSIPNASGTQGSQFTIFFNATDLDVNDTLTFSLTEIGCSIPNPWNVTKIGQGKFTNKTQANATINQTLTNNHVACSLVSISVSDSKETVSQTVQFNITNVNDAPVIEQNSSVNSGVANITQQVAFVSALYSYQVNGSDIDSIVSGGENLTFSDNSSLFVINSSTGLIEFTPIVANIGNHSILITLTDDEGLNDTQVMSLSIDNNTAPSITTSGAFSCAEDSLCTIFINAVDTDGDTINFTSNNTNAFNITDFNASAGVVNFTYNQSFVRNYSINITATDIRGATDTVAISLAINNSNDAPVLSNVVFSNPIVATKPVSFTVTASDEDILIFGGVERLNFSSTFITSPTLFNITTDFENSTNTSTGVIAFTPGDLDDGNHTVNISVVDTLGSVDWQVVSFIVLNDTESPNITSVSPYGTPASNFTVFSFISTFNLTPNRTTINVSENSSAFFNLTVVDDETLDADLNFTWVYNGVVVSTNRSYNRSFNFFSSGDHNLTVIISDDTLENSTWTWLINVSDLNRPPLLITDLENVSISSTETFVSYLYLRSAIRYIDPDDDTNNDGAVNGSETNTLSFSNSACSVATPTITGVDVKFTPDVVGFCTMTFTATDTSGASLISNVILVNVTDVPAGAETTTTTTSTSSGGGGGGGGGGGVSSSVIPINRDVETPRPLNIIAPDEITIYRNKTMTIPVFLENTWNETLKDVRIGAFTNETDVSIEFSQNYFAELANNEKQRVDMVVSGYRLGENFEILINASVDDPRAIDSAVVLMNSIEQTEKGDEYHIKVTFARDLLSTNSECQELNELLRNAERTVGSGDIEKGLDMIDTVINGCKYLISKSQVRHVEQPKMIDFSFFKKINWFYVVSVTLLAVFIIAIVVIEIKIRKERTIEE